MLKVEEKVIGDKRFQVSQFGTTEGRNVLIRLMKMISPIAGAFFNGLDDNPEKNVSVLEMKIPFKSIGAALAQLAYSLSETDLDFIINKLASKTNFEMPNGKLVPLQGDGAFLNAFNNGDGFDYELQNQWLLFALEVNYKSFLKGLGGLGGLSSMVNRAQSESLNTSTGTSTVSRSANGISPV